MLNLINSFGDEPAMHGALNGDLLMVYIIGASSLFYALGKKITFSVEGNIYRKKTSEFASTLKRCDKQGARNLQKA